MTGFAPLGQHYWYDISADMNCDDFFPVFLLYNKKQLKGFGWNVGANLTSERFEHPTPRAFPVIITLCQFSAKAEFDQTKKNSQS